MRFYYRLEINKLFMYDFNKADLNRMSVDKMKSNPFLNFKAEFSISTGETHDGSKTIASFLGIEKFCTINNNQYINLAFSFHKYHNDGSHNYNDFKIIDFVKALIDLSEKFEIDPYLAHVHNIEFGVNLSLPFKTKCLLDSIISYKSKEYKKETYNGRGYLLKFEFDQYELKIYDKGFQYKRKFGIHENIVRFEIKVVKMQYLKSKGIDIKTYSCLLNSNNIAKLSNLLCKAFTELIIFDSSINLKNIKNKSEMEILLNGRNPKYWSKLKSLNPNNLKKKRNRFRELTLKHDSYKMQNSVYELLKDKLKLIAEINPITEQAISDYLMKFNPKSLPEITNFKRPTKSCLPIQNNHLSMGLIKHLFGNSYFHFGRIEQAH